MLHPPVDVDYFAYGGGRKERVAVSRITPEKGLHPLPRIASMLPDHEWCLVGSMGAQLGSGRVLDMIEKEVGRWGARNFHVTTNVPRRELRELLPSAKFYVHPPFAEHFGIAAVEAMAAGCVPIVHRDGGAWTDLVSPLHGGLGYGDPSGIPHLARPRGGIPARRIG